MDSDEQVVFSAGNSWIVCRSKSHSGRIYYFNTLTGEAAWNLSSAEIEKAKTRTKILTKQDNINIEACPEPKEPPMDQAKEMSSVNQTSPASTIYNKQIINNKFSKPRYSMAPVIIPPYNHLVANQLNTIMPLALNAQDPGYNTSVWAVPPTHQIFIGPTISPLVNQGQTTAVNFGYNNQEHILREQVTSTSLSKRFSNLRTKGFNSTPSQKFQRNFKFTSPTNKRLKDWSFNYQNNYYKRNLTANDLRQVLSARKQGRRASFSDEHKIDKEVTLLMDGLSGNTSESEVNVNKNEERHKEKDDGNNADSDWIEENILVGDRRLKLNISNLKEMAKPGMETDCWYIVADKDILLYHLYFLNTLSNSDDNCYLMVAQQVLAELRELSRGSPAVGDARRARRALTFLQKQLDDGYVVIGDGTCGENGTRSDYLLDCCSNLLEDNYHVILLSNDNELNSYKNITSIPIFNIKEIKQFLTKSKPLSQEHNRTKQSLESKTSEIKKTDRLKPPPCMMKPMPQNSKRPIKITVANDLVQKYDDNLNVSEVNRKEQLNRDAAKEYEVNKETPYNRVVTNVSEGNEETPYNRDVTNACEGNEETSYNRGVTNACEGNKETPYNRDVTNACEGNEETPYNRDVTNACEENEETSYNRGVTNACERNKETQLNRNVANACEVNEVTQFNRDITNACEGNNETQFYSGVANACKVNKETKLNRDIAPVGECNETELDKSEVDNHMINFNVHKKYTSEAAVQTETETLNEPSVSNDNELIFNQICRTKDKKKIFKKEKKVNKNAQSAESARKEIRLNRSISVKTATSIEDTSSEKKQFKWRRRRYTSGTANDSKMSPVDSSNVEKNSRDSVNAQKNAYIEQQSSQKKSDESISSETSSLVIVKNLFNDSVVIEETSNSGIISNSTIDSESEIGSKLSSSMLSNYKQKIEPLKTIMYKITDKEMEDSLRIMNDEWISRFIQIMEEVLTQVLRKDERFLVNVVYKLHGGGPWTIWEAAECIKIKFSNDCNIVNAATKLTNVFKRISDNTGRITYNLEPSEYMEMYSLGAYLVSSLQRARRDCEDVAGAARALAVLLDDIRSPERGVGLDSFGEQARDTEPHANTETDKQISKSKDERVESVKLINEVAMSQGTSAANSPKKVGERSYNLRSRNKSQELKEQENKIEENVKLNRKPNKQDSFFDSLNLIKKTTENTPVAKLIFSTHAASNDPNVASSSQGLIRSIFDRNLNGCNEESNKNFSCTETTVIRKFTVFPEFENKIKKTVVREPLDMDQLDYTAMYEEEENSMNDEYYSDEECYENGHGSQVSKDDVIIPSERHANVENCGRNGGASSKDLPVACTDLSFLNIGDDRQFSPPIDINKNLDTLFSTIIRRVKEALLDAEKFCKETYKELSQSQVHSIRRKYEINESAVKTLVLLDNLSKSLNSILHRENYELEKNIQSLLKEENIDNNLNENQLNLYRDVIGKCIDQAGILQESVTLIVSVIKKQPIE